MNDLALYSLIFLGSVFISAIGQVLLKKSAMRTYDSAIKEYLNPLVIGGYTIFLASTLITMYAYKVVPLSMGPVLESTSYIYVTIFGVTIFKESLSKRKLLALMLIMVGILVYSLGAA